MADNSEDVAVRLRIVDQQGHPLTGTVDIEFEPQDGGQTLEIKGANASGDLDVTGLSRISPAVYKITVTPTTVFAPTAQFVMIPPSGFKTVVFAAGMGGHYDHGGHNDDPHADVDHLDGIHADIHSDTTHTDEGHTDHTDDYWDEAHVDSPHEDHGHDDQHNDQFGDDHGDQGHSDNDHNDNPHDDVHLDYHYDLHGDHDDHDDHDDNASFGGEHFDSFQPFLPPLTYTLLSQLQDLIATLHIKVPSGDPVLMPIINTRLIALSASIQQLFGQTPVPQPQRQVHPAVPPSHTDTGTGGGH